MAHIAPLPPRSGPGGGAVYQDFTQLPYGAVVETTGERQFKNLLREVKHLYLTYQDRFPPGATSWGFYLAGRPNVTNELRTIASEQFAGLGLPDQHTYYEHYTRADRLDEFRVGVQIDGGGTTSFYVEANCMESIDFPTPLPDPHASQSTGLAHTRNYLALSPGETSFKQSFFGREIPAEQLDFTHLTGVYDVWVEGPAGTFRWVQYDFRSMRWRS